MVVSLDCAAFKRDCGAEPQAVSARPNLIAHQAKCSDCGEFYQEMLALDVQMSAAFNLPIAQNSLDEQLSAAALEQHENVIPFKARTGRGGKQKYAWLGAAASVLLASFLFVGTTTDNAFAGEIIEHIHHEPHLLTLTEAMHTDEQINMVLKQANVSMKPNNLKVLAAKLCPFEGRLAAHLVVQGESGQPVTLLIMPGTESGTKPGLIESNEFNGRILTAEHGTMAVVGGKRENVEQLGNQISDSIQWLN